MSPNAPMWMKVMRELLHNAKIVLKPDQLAVTSLAAEMASMQVDPMTTIADTSHTIFRPSETNPAKACHPTPYAEKLWKCIAQICKEQKKKQPDNIYRPGATATLLEWEEYILEHRPKLLSSSRIPKMNTSTTLTAAEARKQSLRPKAVSKPPPINQLPTPETHTWGSRRGRHSTPVVADSHIEQSDEDEPPEDYMKNPRQSDASDGSSNIAVVGTDEEPSKDARLSPLLSLSDHEDLQTIQFKKRKSKKSKSKSKSSTPRQTAKADDGKRDICEIMDEEE